MNRIPLHYHQINFVIGAQGTSEAADLRVSLGHPEPFALTFVEVGNEDFFAANMYVFRWHDFVETLQAQFPDLPWFAQNSFFYDGFERNVTKDFEVCPCFLMLSIMTGLFMMTQGEYAAISTNPDVIFGTPADGRLTFPPM
ncbi:hypothetical protein C0989_001215 [Termitomyces sp. Mn162]|nr:hypothetical protein C0989_001215 [Termitomyces sp. Mn162]